MFEHLYCLGRRVAFPPVCYRSLNEKPRNSGNAQHAHLPPSYPSLTVGASTNNAVRGGWDMGIVLMKIVDGNKLLDSRRFMFLYDRKRGGESERERDSERKDEKRD